ncbi:MAG: CoA transferase [Dehalococcoidia bacterium]|nr:MAG: CoA transferase [Dehalococcoidia bacterium]
MVEQALKGLKVIEWGDFISAPYCTKLMADLGADVIKVEKPGSGDESRQYGPFPDDVPHPDKSGLYLYLNSNKMSITLDVRNSKGHEILAALLREADVFVENHSSKEMAELGLDYASLKELNPRLIVTSITPFGQTGPYKDYKGYAINTAGLGGHSMRTGEPTREPLSPPLSQSHYQGGAMGAASTIGALFARMSTDMGQHVDISEADVWATIHLGHGVHLALFEGRTSMRAGHRTISVYPWCVLACKDGYMCLIAIQGYQWKRFLEAMGNPEWMKDERFQNRILMAMEHADELDALVQAWLIDHTKEEVFDICREKQITFAPIRDVAEVARDPHFEERGYFVDIDNSQTGIMRYPGAPYKMSETPWCLDRPAPLLGVHNLEIYGERLGYSTRDIEKLQESGVI